MSTKKLYAGLGVVALVAACVGGFFLSFKRVKKQVRVPPSGEARTNPYLAVERLLGDYGFAVETVHRLSEPGGERDLLVLADPQPRLTPEQQEVWQSWVGGGGHLVMAAPLPGLTAAPFVASLGFSKLGEDQQPNFDETPSRSYACDCTSVEPLDWGSDESDWVATARLEADNKKSGEEDSSRRRLAISRPLGEGRVTLVNDVSRFDNRHVGTGEFATLVHDIATMGTADSGLKKARIVRFTAQRSWYLYVLRATWPAALVLAVIVLLALFQSGYRFGPIVPPPPQRRRSRSEHVRATGEFLWEHDGADRLLEATRASLIDALERKYPALRKAEGSRRREMICEILDLGEEERAAIFDTRTYMPADQFTRRIRLMENYRRQL